MPTDNSITDADCGHEEYRMLIKQSSEFCDLLFRKYNPKNYLKTNSASAYGCDAKKVHRYLDPSIASVKRRSFFDRLRTCICRLFGCLPKAKETLVGYIIKPYTPAPIGTNRSIPDDEINVNIKHLKFFPVWLLEKPSGYEEVLEKGIVFEYSHISKYQAGGYPCDGHVLGEPVMAGQSEFDHNTFQYYTEGTFNKAFISRHDLFLIANYSEYIGIVGAKISTGNYVTHKFEDDNPTTMTDCNVDYFTYRFIGLCEKECRDSELGDDEIVLIAANNGKCGQESTLPHLRTNDDNDPNSSTQTGAHGNPCPPSWRPQP